MLSLIRNHSFVVIFFILTMAMGLLFISNLTKEESHQGPLMGKQENVFIDQKQNSQGIIVNGERMFE
ncbi:hypothetical protein D4T97_019065 [Siminovitchia acidinfaciens]|uniref:Uncharacterized protein n=1 Tax=Siminovitchia acidinfaciens TaxID=2321395 RepID=A0A429XTV2_9BACI|nr:hypothetical protein [Siminovitchia acidinfaciens]RST71265.1 hypothetical protein D4T97_019065 [Siminovitchia acidinfaciens]VEF48273.1 Uncharacterised protein [Bacillus freudenreichii]